MNGNARLRKEHKTQSSPEFSSEKYKSDFFFYKIKQSDRCVALSEMPYG